MFHARWAVAVGIASAVAISGVGLAIAEVRAPLMKQGPTIDGAIGADEWAFCAGFDGFGSNDGELVQRRVRAYVGATLTHIYVAIKSRLPDDGELLAAVTRNSAKAVYDDAVEVFVNPCPHKPGQVEYQLLTNSLGKSSYQVHTRGGATENAAWRGNWTQKHGFHDGWWHFECAIPIASMGQVADGRKTTDGAWKINLARDWKYPWQWSSLSAAPGGYAFSGVRFVFANDGPAVQYQAESDPFLARFSGTLQLHNQSDHAMDLDVSLVLGRNRMPAIRVGKKVSLAPGRTQAVVLRVPQDDATTRFELRVKVTSEDGKVTFYDRDVCWPKGKAYRYVAGQQRKVDPLAFRFAYYPYRNRMRILADVNGLRKDAVLRKLTAEVRRRGGGDVVRREAFDVGAFQDGRQEIALALPPLEGEYEIALTAEGENVPSRALVHELQRKVFPWERNRLGRSTSVYPPFEPITMEGRRLRTVLREHRLNDVGLWDQVTAASAETGVTKPILAGPMRYVGSVEGKPAVVQSKPLEVITAKEHQVVTRSRFSVGPVACEATNTWDYDGTAKVELTIGPTGAKSLDELTLEIPFADAAVPLIHANSDRIRAPVAQQVPAGAGVVWDGSQVASDEMTRDFCPYVYLGDAVRGVCWFADNDLGWNWDRKTPNVTLVRRGKVLTLRVHLVNKPLLSDRSRKITFGLLAAPVKPRLSPVGPNWWRYRYYRDQYTLLGTDINWLARGNCGSVYPAAKDLYLWEMIRRGNRQRLSQEEIEKVVVYGAKYFAPYGEEKLKSWAAHVRHNLRSRYGKKMAFYYNRASYQLAEEFETFKDEWGLTDFRSVPKGTGLSEIKIVPSDSYIDHALYWYGQSFDRGGNQAVYWDNFFIAPSFNTQMTDAYRQSNGGVTPAAGIWALRDLCKRTFVMMNERDMLPITFPHMTSFNPLPMMAFATLQYDWEWKYSLGDVQDRFPRELILLTSTGDLAGVWPVPLGDHGKMADDQWTQRTFSAVRLVHELDGYGGWGSEWTPSHKANRKLFDPVLSMLDEPNLLVYRYWDERPQPVKAMNPDVPTIVYSVPGAKAVAVATSYADQDSMVTLGVDCKALELPTDCKVSDVETGQVLKLREGCVALRLKKHDLKVLLFEGAN